MDEIVALFDESGARTGRAPRSVVRLQNLWHAATGILVYNTGGEVYVHRRTDTKDLYPGLHDFCCGGVLLADEEPDDGAAREANEELGIDTPVTFIGIRSYADDATRFHCYQYTCVFDGPIVWQREEVAWGRWLSVSELLAWIGKSPGDFVPDTVALAVGLLRQ